MDQKRYYLSPDCRLRWLEEPSLYHIGRDELYDLDESAFEFLRNCSSEGGCLPLERELLNYCIEEGILRDTPSYTERPSIRKSPVPSLRYLELQLTDRCNLGCKHCYIGPSRSRSLPLERVIGVIEEFEKMQGLRLLITGGEPFMYPEFSQLNERLPDFGLRKILFTNGLLLTEPLIDSLNVQELQISIDGMEDGHEAIRGKGTYRKTINVIDMAMARGFEVSISTMVHSRNLNDFGAMERLFSDMGIKDWTVDVPCSEGYLRDNPHLQLSPEVAGRYLRYGFGEGLHGGGEGYTCGLHLMSVLPDGRVAKCAFYSDQTVGHLDEGLQICWQRIKPIRLEELNCSCELIDSCRGGCRYRAELLGDPLGKDLYRCVGCEEQ